MNKSWAGTAITGLVVVGIGVFLFLNLQPGRPSTDRVDLRPVSTDKPAKVEPAALPGSALAVREYPIGDEVERNQIRVAAVWLPAVMMDNMPSDPTMHPIHIEADVKAAENNANGFAKDEKIPYLKIAYAVVPAAGGSPVASGELLPMMARDGFHYGATIAMPAPGDYKLVYDLQPPSAGGLGRHSDPATGVAPWWQPFSAQFDWTVAPNAMNAATVSLR